ncbi:hypothetical protein F4808DRAFT_411294 [Astrocystis sublimbata]|nr:hypothetical protein F4808DRAFT_411294 [Astrocystis sublimbata]
MLDFKGPWIDAVRRGDTQSDPESLVSTSYPVSFEVGTGASIYTRSLLPAILKAQHEVILVTCFWERSSTLSALRETLEQLADLRQDHIRNSADGTLPPLNVYICFSSRSFFQKLFHTFSPDGYVYHPSEWASKLGLPEPRLLKAGRINLQVKSLFFLPFSVMHPKFLIVDRQRAWLPSCNVAPVAWFEGCIEIVGDTIAPLLRFYHSVWDRQSGLNTEPQLDGTWSPGGSELASIQCPVGHRVALQQQGITPTILLPSYHHRNPHFRPFPWQKFPRPPATPLNCAILHLIATASKKLYLQTPNLTATTVVDALLEALDRGVEVTIVTSKGLMNLEQLLTGGTITSWRLQSFIKMYERRRKLLSGPSFDPEAQPPRLGSLEIFYYQPLPASERLHEEPVHSHLKLTVVDDAYVVLGSGNLDRASWFTSQELGILFHSIDLATSVTDTVSRALRGRLHNLFSSNRRSD